MMGGAAANAAATAMAGSTLGSNFSIPVADIASMVASINSGNAAGRCRPLGWCTDLGWMGCGATDK